MCQYCEECQGSGFKLCPSLGKIIKENICYIPCYACMELGVVSYSKLIGPKEIKIHSKK